MKFYFVVLADMGNRRGEMGEGEEEGRREGEKNGESQREYGSEELRNLFDIKSLFVFYCVSSA